jgi:hypothetical protein
MSNPNMPDFPREGDDTPPLLSIGERLLRYLSTNADRLQKFDGTVELEGGLLAADIVVGPNQEWVFIYTGAPEGRHLAPEEIALNALDLQFYTVYRHKNPADQ